MGNTILKHIGYVELITCLYDPYNIIVFDRHVISSTYLMWFNIVFPINMAHIKCSIQISLSWSPKTGSKLSWSRPTANHMAVMKRFQGIRNRTESVYNNRLKYWSPVFQECIYDVSNIQHCYYTLCNTKPYHMVHVSHCDTRRDSDVYHVTNKTIWFLNGYKVIPKF